MIPGLSVIAPRAKTTTSPGHPASAVREQLSRAARPRSTGQRLLPHLVAESLPLYKAVGADLIVLVVACGAQTLLFPAWGLRAIALPLFAVLVALFAFSEGIYSPDADPFPERIVPGLARSVLFAVALVFFAERGETSPLAAFVTFVSSLGALQLYRGARRFVWARGNHEGESRNVLIVGGGPIARSIARTLYSDPLHRAFVRGSIDDDLPLSATVLGRVSDLDWLARSMFIDEVIIAVPGRPELAREAVEAAFRNHLDIRAVPNLPPGNWPEAGVNFIGDVPVVTLHHEHVPSVELFVKRVLDVMGASIGLALASPVMAIVVLLIRLDSRGPIIYGAERTGAKGRRFRCYKFRSMVSNAEYLKANLQAQNQRQGPIFKIVDDPRITRIGRFIRRYSLDELPQLWNVLMGDMSMVGPRPHPVDEVNHYELHHYRRLDMKPGITGLWQITARHSPSFELNMHLDLTYIENWTLRLDMRILLGTIRVLFMPEGA